MPEHSSSESDVPPVRKRSRTPRLERDIPLGAFQLERLIGVGGMGEVWQGYHRTQGIPVAVKVITAQRARDPRYREAFANEVRAVAGLDHPGVVMVFDYGQVDARAEKASKGRMVAGSPFLAMELADGGSLRSQPSPTTWTGLKELLQALLDVLAHAHARGVIHRDLKPANVLVFHHGAQARLALTDFGLAHATDSAERGVRGTSGTPTYMAPEQFLGQWRDFGPWTDLYALGCIAYALANGGPPFQGGGPTELRQAHLASEPASLSARLPVPAGYSQWVARLMAKDPIHRFQTAADAIWALQGLGNPPIDRSTPVPVEPLRIQPSRVTLDLSNLQWDTAMLVNDGREKGYGALVQGDMSHLIPRTLPTLPQDWRVRSKEHPSMQLVGAGLGLYGMRAVPIVGREAERDELWARLAEARATGGTRAVVLQGGAGTGKSRLAEWLCQRGLELGVAVSAKAVHSSGGGAADGTPRLVQRILAGVGTSRGELLRRAQHWMARRGVEDDYEWKALVELVWPATEADLRAGATEIRFSSPQERYALVHRLLEHLAGGIDEVDSENNLKRRAVIVWLDDVQWGPDALSLARYLLRNGRERSCPIVVVLTVQDEALEDRPVERAMLRELLKEPHATRLTIDPLDGDDRSRLVHELLGLEGDLAAQVQERTGGNPLFAVQLVGDWVQRGVLSAGRTGFVLRQGEHAVLPDDIHQLWVTRIDKVLEQEPLDHRSALELAALLGNEVDDAEWRGACAVAKLPVPHALIETLIKRRLAKVQSGGWTFAHGMLRESLERSAAEAARAADLHDACATTLQIRYEAVRTPGLAERLGRHLYQAQRLDEALEPLSEAAAERRASSDYEEALRLVDLRDEVMARLEVDVSDARWGEGWALRADLLIGLGRFSEAESLSLRLAQYSQTHGWRHLRPTAYRHAGSVAAKQGQLDQAEAHLMKGLDAAHETGREIENARILMLLGDIARLRGDPPLALQRCRKALAQFSALGDARGQADVLVAMSAACRALGDPQRTESYARQAIPLFEKVGSRFGVASCENALAEVLRARGDLENAERAYAAAEKLLRQLGSPEHRVPQLNLGLVLLARGHHDRAQAVLEEVLHAFRRGGRRGLEGALHAFLLPCAANDMNWASWNLHLRTARALLDESGFVDRDIAWAAGIGADKARELGANLEALDALDLARRQWAALGQHEMVGETEQRAKALEVLMGTASRH